MAAVVAARHPALARVIAQQQLRFLERTDQLLERVSAPDSVVELERLRGLTYRYLYDRITAQVSSAQVLSLTSTWRNVNVAPTYQNWKVTHEIAGDGWPPAATLTSAVDLRNVPPGATPIITDRIDLTTLWAGSYKVYLKVIDPSGYRTPMNLGIQGRDSQGRYLLGTVVLT